MLLLGVGFALATVAIVIGYLMGRYQTTREHIRLLTAIESRTVVLQHNVDRWMKAATTLATKPSLPRGDPRRDPE